MKPRITMITMGVDDLERSMRFYLDGLGLATKEIVGERLDPSGLLAHALRPLRG